MASSSLLPALGLALAAMACARPVDLEPPMDAGAVPADVGSTADEGPAAEPMCESTWGDFCGGRPGADRACDDGCFCNGREECLGGTCGSARPACDDGNPCTEDLCDEAERRCSHVPRDELCDDGNECTGEEVCDLDLGCLPGIPLSCGDGDQCTMDLCVPGEGCVNRLRDLDDDGFADRRCGGLDCNDDMTGGAAVNPDAEEICIDGIDNDCNGLADLLDEASCPMLHDDCSRPRVLRSGELVSFPRSGLSDDYGLSCGSPDDLPDAVFRFTLTEEQEVTLQLSPSVLAVLEVRPSARCRDNRAGIACAVLGGPGRSRLDFAYPGRGSLPAGSYDVIVGLPDDGPYDLFFEARDPAPPPRTDRCDADAPVIRSSVSLDGHWAGHRDRYPNVACGNFPNASSEIAHRLELAMTSDVTIRVEATAQTGFPSDVRFALVRSCEDPRGTNIGCGRSDFRSLNDIELRALPAGSYWILIGDDGVTPSVGYAIDVTIAAAR